MKKLNSSIAAAYSKPWLYTVENAKSSGNSIIQSLADGNMAVLDQLYDQYRDDFLRWTRQRFSVKNRYDLIDAWHDTMIMFYERVRDKKLTQLTCEVKTYLFIIGYRRLLKMHKESEKTDLVKEFEVNMNIDERLNVSELEEINEQQQTLLKEAVNKLPEKSREILVMRFMEGKSVTEIMEIIGYASENAVRVTLSRSLKKLKEIINERMASPVLKQNR